MLELRLLRTMGCSACLLTAAACTSVGDSATSVASAAAVTGAAKGVIVYQLRGSRQCEPGSGTAPEVMRTALEAEGVRVWRSACGSDGRMRIAACGASTGQLNLFDIAPEDLPRAEVLGYVRLSSLRADPASPPSEVACP